MLCCACGFGEPEVVGDGLSQIPAAGRLLEPAVLLVVGLPIDSRLLSLLMWMLGVPPYTDTIFLGKPAILYFAIFCFCLCFLFP